MALYRQSGADRFAGRATHDLDHHQLLGSNGGAAGEHLSIRIPHKQGRIRRPGHKGQRRIPVAAVAVTIALGLLVSLSVIHYLFRDKEGWQRSDEDDQEQENDTKQGTDIQFRPGSNHSVPSKEVNFGRGSIKVGRDSRYWDRDDRRRDEEYDEDDSELSNIAGGSANESALGKEGRRRGAEQLAGQEGKSIQKQQSSSKGLYNEEGLAELKEYEQKYKESLKDTDQGNGDDQVDSIDEYDDGFDMDDAIDDGLDETGHSDGNHLDEAASTDNDGDVGTVHRVPMRKVVEAAKKGASADTFKKADSVVILKSSGDAKKRRHAGSQSAKSSSSEKKSGLKGKPRRSKFPGCEMKFLNSTDLLLEPIENKKFSRFSLQYTEVEERPTGAEKWEPRFSGHQSLEQREESFYARDQKINCGFIKGPKGLPSTGFDLAEDDVKFMSSCHIAVSSCIFGNSDHLRTPFNKMITRSSRKNVCFVMFVDENTLQMLSAEGQKPDRMGFVGLWKIVVVKNLPYTDMRRVGKIPKFLTHRLFPSARYSIWLDSKLRLQSDPQLLLEYFLWRKGYEYAISNHYDRHCVWEEVMQNKRLNKFNHTIIDEQFAFYQADGLKRFNPLDPNKLLPSYVPEGSFIMRAHTPMSNLFSCLWFNEVDRFTPRDQLSFAYTYLKLRRMNPEKSFHLNMFKDCERRAIAKLFHHRAEEKWNIPTQAAG